MGANAKGFTLLEVMVAVFILAVSAAALSRAAAQATRSTEQLELRQHASWVAQNQLALIVCNSEIDLDGEVRFAGHSFYWKAAKSTTDFKNFQRIKVTVSTPAAPDYQLAELTGFTYHD